MKINLNTVISILQCKAWNGLNLYSSFGSYSLDKLCDDMMINLDAEMKFIDKYSHGFTTEISALSTEPFISAQSRAITKKCIILGFGC